MSTLTGDPLRPVGPGGAPAAPTGADWDPLSQPWPALFPPPLPAAPVAPRAPSAPRRAPAALRADGSFPSVPGAPLRPGSPVPSAWAQAGRAVPRLALPPEPKPARDVSPSRLAYRLNRLWLTPAVRRFVCQGLPAMVLVGATAIFWAGDARRAAVIGVLADLRTAVENRPEFRIEQIRVDSATPEVAQAVTARLGIALPASSMRLDLPALRARVEGLDAVSRASVQVVAGGVLEVRVSERVPTTLWRGPEGLALLDAEGRRVALVAHRAVRPDLPLIAGEGAPEAIAEARLLLAAADPIRHRVLGLTRVGERRWDLVLDRDQRILLPATGAVSALERMLALDATQDLLARDILAVDLRNPQRPTLRLNPEASAELARIRHLDTRMANR